MSSIRVILLLIFAYILLGHGNRLADNPEFCVVSSELEEECGSVCYPIVKPLLRYLAVCQQKDLQITQLQERVLEQQLEIINGKSQADMLNSLNKQLTEQQSTCGLNSALQSAINELNIAKENVEMKATIVHKDEIIVKVQQQTMEIITDARKTVELLEDKLNSLMAMEFPPCSKEEAS
ncbi:uncharacterized protein LOC111064716 [Drosophila obscura]|uniref:uncharacterized protein LOC111064716 n=1 Tax=Drosophila obscura TaxID=7282 RepID=UPI001BB29812|nr:uncharacterized protein LOC111064716 [Drosophila obscura]